ncbi:50S ribosomal protein L1, chloroplastic-like [Camellia sinensis]|uniref:50S ribosomal protein L1, chloroplastic-like n=1 Tax=Camellia sinensis TaxID=4442 RepID=UPI0010369576|nr:50S ribosomal protein L1, chloroplastic-like [Camellia sinensis]
MRTQPIPSVIKSDRRRSKRFSEIQKLRENKKVYDLKTEISLLKQMASTKFVEKAEAHFRLNIDPKYNDQQLRATVNLPKGTGQTVRLSVLTQGIAKFRDEISLRGADCNVLLWETARAIEWSLER